MTFTNDKPIYIQMADLLCDDILAGKFVADDRIPSVREFAVQMEVNTNTAVKTYDMLSRDNIIYNKRGLGYFVSPDALADPFRPQTRVPRTDAALTLPPDVAPQHLYRRGRGQLARARQAIIISNLIN